MLPARLPDAKEHTMEQHVRIVAILNIVCGGLGLVIALLVLLVFGGLAGIANSDSSPDVQGAAILGMIGAIAFIAIAVISVPSLIGGLGLLKYREWARILLIVLSALNLLNIPIGTALGIYGLWTLLNDETRVLFKKKEGEWSAGELQQPGS